MKLNELLLVLPFFSTVEAIDAIEINDIEMDSREVKPGNLFVCIKGYTVDGHDYVDQAIANGAIAIIAEKKLDTSVPVITVSDTAKALAMLSVKFYDYPTSKFPLLGVTGTNGKTTVTYLLEAIFHQHNKKTGVIGTIQMKIGEKAYPVKNTTPDTLFLQKMFHQMAKDQVQTAIMEVSSHALDQGRVHGCDFDVAIFTNLSQDHLDYHQSMDDYLRAKSLLFAQLGNSYNEQTSKFAVINVDDAASDLLIRSTAQPVITYGCDNPAQVSAENIQLDAAKTTFTLTTPVGNIAISSRLIGMFNIYNMLAASAAAITMHVPITTIKAALETISGVDGRFEPVLAGQSFATLVDYAHTPDSLENVLQTIKGFAKGNVYVVVGCGGDRDKKKRPLMAAIALKYADLAIFTSDNPRTEDPEAILKDMTKGLSANNYDVIVNRKEAISYAIEQAKDDDIVLIAGKGHETYQQIGTVKYDFDDRQVAKEAIQAKEN
ncbi:UDP-N-acetylmuramoyl-L-alanyl-D-glutamate--2,6-diaminopimelate ligase [Lentibacillus sp. N15]|uniref:UDP-N-acetylmuramoyl-L-alanyl-D-glutamate--2, 6-diaminopimelate ligase n=1 Tax=Lentibacillus songyuanensis TaxID=3136161 RepID=UPI0031BA14BF